MAQLNGFSASQLPESGISPAAATATRRANLLTYWNGAGYSTATLGNAGATYTLGTATGNYRLAGLPLLDHPDDRPVIVDPVSTATSGSAPCQTAACTSTATAGGVQLVVQYDITQSTSALGQLRRDDRPGQHARSRRRTRRPPVRKAMARLQEGSRSGTTAPRSSSCSISMTIFSIAIAHRVLRALTVQRRPRTTPRGPTPSGRPVVSAADRPAGPARATCSTTRRPRRHDGLHRDDGGAEPDAQRLPLHAHLHAGQRRPALRPVAGHR